MIRRLMGLVIVLGLVAIPPAIPAQDDSNEEPKATVPVVVFAGSIMEKQDPLALFVKPSPTLFQYVETFRQAAEDPDVPAVLVRFEGPSWGLAQAMEIADALQDLRDAGKAVYISTDSLNIIDYTIASGASEIALPPVGIVDLHGLSFAMYYMSDMLGKLGIQADAVNEGKYKDAFDPFLRNEMSDATREQMQVLLDDLFSSFVTRVAKNRGISDEQANDYLVNGPYTSAAALEIGAIDRLAYHSDMKDIISEELGAEPDFEEEYGALRPEKAEPPNFMSLLMGTAGKAKKAKTAGDHIAIVYASGPIVDGRVDDSNPFMQQEMIASDDFIDLLDEVMEGGVKAIVLRVSSPGGSAIASDRIWNRLEEIQADGIPVVVSMGDYAASGGYYISMGADRIVAQPTTITGSIGVIGGKFSLGETYNKVGITRQEMGIGPYSNIYSEASLWSEEEEVVMERLLDSIYMDFRTKAAEGRDMSVDELTAVAEGRIWSGLSAQSNGLVDELGGVETAIGIARELADAPDIPTLEYPRPETLMDIIEKALSGKASVQMQGGAGLPSSLTLAREALPRAPLNYLLFMLGTMKDEPKAMMIAPTVTVWQ